MTNKVRYYLQEGFIRLFYQTSANLSVLDKVQLKVATAGIDHNTIMEDIRAGGGLTTEEAIRYGTPYKTDAEFNTLYSEWLQETGSNFMNLLDALKAPAPAEQ